MKEACHGSVVVIERRSQTPHTPHERGMSRLSVVIERRSQTPHTYASISHLFWKLARVADAARMASASCNGGPHRSFVAICNARVTLVRQVAPTAGGTRAQAINIEHDQNCESDKTTQACVSRIRWNKMRMMCHSKAGKSWLRHTWRRQMVVEAARVARATCREKCVCKHQWARIKRRTEVPGQLTARGPVSSVSGEGAQVQGRCGSQVAGHCYQRGLRGNGRRRSLLRPLLVTAFSQGGAALGSGMSSRWGEVPWFPG